MAQKMKTYSIVLATYNKSWALPQVLDSILPQLTDEGELIIVDDGSTDETEDICQTLSVRYTRLNDAVGRARNPSVARNVGYRMAAGEIIISQSDDVVHVGKTLAPLVNDLKEGQFCIASVQNYGEGTFSRQRTGPDLKRPYFFLGSLWRKDLYAVGGNDEDFEDAGGEDDWFADCLIQGLRLQPVYSREIIGHHLIHASTFGSKIPSAKILKRKRASKHFVSSGGSWLPK